MKPLAPKSEGSPSRLSQTLDRLAQQSAAKRAKQGDGAAPTAKSQEQTPVGKGNDKGAKLDATGANADEDVFQSAPSKHEGTPVQPRPPSAVVTSGGGALSARFAALSGDLSGTGRVVHGDLTLANAADCAGLAGVKAILGTLSIVEADLTSKDLAPLRSLTEVGGLALEGNPALTDLSALAALKNIDGACYLGFNPGLNQVSLPHLEHIEGALIIEGNPALTHVDLRGLKDVGRYVHVCENPELTTINVEALVRLEELVVTDNPRLAHLSTKTLQKPDTLEVGGSNGLTLAFAK